MNKKNDWDWDWDLNIMIVCLILIAIIMGWAIVATASDWHIGDRSIFSHCRCCNCIKE